MVELVFCCYCCDKTVENNAQKDVTRGFNDSTAFKLVARQKPYDRRAWQKKTHAGQ